MRGGFVAVPVNIRFPPETVSYILDAAGVTFAFTDTSHAALPGPGIPTVNFDIETLRPAAHPFPTVRPGPGETAQVLFTSGSTGRPKAVPLSHEGQLWSLRQSRRLAPPDPPSHTLRHIVVQPLFHMNGLFLTKVMTMGQGSMVMLPHFDGRTYLETIAHWTVTSITAVPTMMARALKETDLLERLDFSHVRSVRVGSAPVTQALLERMQSAFPNAAVSNGYGTTEGGPFVLVLTPGASAPPDVRGLSARRRRGEARRRRRSRSGRAVDAQPVGDAGLSALAEGQCSRSA